MKNKQSPKQVLLNNIFLMKICFTAAPGFVLIYILEVIRSEVVIFMEFTFGLNYVLESAEFGRPFSYVLIFLLSLLAFVVIGLLFGSWSYQKMHIKTMPKIKKHLKDMLYAKAKEIDLECYDNPEFYNDFILSVSEADNQIDRTFQLFTMLFTGLTSFVTSGVFFITKDATSFLFIFAALAMTFIMSKKINKLNFDIRVKKNPYERNRNYINRVFYLNDYAKEIRLNTALSEELLKDFNSINDEILNIDKANAKKRFWYDFVRNYICNDFISDVLYIGYLVYKAAMLHLISYSNVAVLYSSSNRMKNRLRQFSDIYPFAQETSLYVERIHKFLELKPKIVSEKNLPVPEHPGEIELRNVSFAYNEKDGYILKNVNLKINPYSKVAFVGYNGAGKTTLIKIIMRLYDVNEGEVLLNGVNIKDYNVEQYRQRIGAIFQDYKLYAATVKENILLDFPEKADEKNVFDAIEKSGFTERLQTLDNGLETHLTTEFEKDGVNLSGGESQKVAIARVFYSNTNLIVLDEPSSALDPIAEYHLNHSMLEAAERKTVIFISHRLSTTRSADMIYMLEDGQVIEEGTHDELLRMNAKYAQMWKAQAGQYYTA